MKRTLFLLVLVFAVTLAIRSATAPELARAGGTAKTTISIAARVAEFSEWADPSPVIIEADWSGPIAHVNQKQTATRALVLYTNTDATISVRPALNGGILTKAGTTQTLDTAYRVTGDVAAPDAGFRPAAQFFGGGNYYLVNYASGKGAYQINVEVEMASRPNAAPEEGVYVCGITLTAGW